MYKKLNSDQKKAVDSVITGYTSGISHLIYGSAGTGKSFVISTLKNYYISQNINFAVTASTGIAGMLIGGRTLHSCFSILKTRANIDQD